MSGGNPQRGEARMRNVAADAAGALVVDDDPFARGMLVSALTGLSWDPVRQAATVAEGLWLARHQPPVVAVLDLDLGEGPTGMDLAHGLRRAFPMIGLVIISTYEDPRLMGMNQPPLPAGSIYLVKRTVTDTEVLGRAIQLAVDGPKEGDAVKGRAGSASEVSQGLSDQQVEIMRLISAGYSNGEIARLRVMSISGVEKVVAKLIRQLHIAGGRESSQRVLIAQAYFRLTGAVSARRG
jgi:DNA-binding NarL/FixJ family response regulator